MSVRSLLLSAPGQCPRRPRLLRARRPRRLVGLNDPFGLAEPSVNHLTGDTNGTYVEHLVVNPLNSKFVNKICGRIDIVVAAICDQSLHFGLRELVTIDEQKVLIVSNGAPPFNTLPDRLRCFPAIMSSSVFQVLIGREPSRDICGNFLGRSVAYVLKGQFKHEIICVFGVLFERFIVASNVGAQFDFAGIPGQSQLLGGGVRSPLGFICGSTGFLKSHEDEGDANHAEAHTEQGRDSHDTRPERGLPLGYKISLVVLVSALLQITFGLCFRKAIYELTEGDASAGLAGLLISVAGIFASIIGGFLTVTAFVENAYGY